MSVRVALILILCGLGLGAFSSVLFVWQWVLGSPNTVIASGLLLAAGVVFFNLFSDHKIRIPGTSRVMSTAGMFRRLPVVCWVLGLAVAGFGLLQHGQMLPHGGWDAFAVWNVHARFLHRGDGDVWRVLFDPALSAGQNDYPLLLPGLINGLWLLAGSELPQIPAIVAVAFTALTLGLLCAAVSALVRDERGWMAGLLLLATPSFLLNATSQAADIPIAFYMLAAVVLLQFAGRWPEVREPMLILAGFSAGCAAWTKNEGLLFMIAIVIGQMIAFAWFHQWQVLPRNLMMVGFGFLPMLTLILVYKSALAPGSSPVETLQSVASTPRYAEIAYGFYDQAKGFGGTWQSGGVHPFVLAAVFVWLYRWRLKDISAMSLSLAVLLLVMLGGYFSVYVLSSHPNVIDYVSGSLDRLYLQLWPAAIFILSTLSVSTARNGSLE